MNYTYNVGSFSGANTVGSDLTQFMEVFKAIVSAMLGVFVVVGILAVITLIARWKVFKKAGREGWIALIPNYNTVVELEMAGIPGYYWFIPVILGLIAMIPVLGTIVCFVGLFAYLFWKSIKLVKTFGKGTLFGVLMVFFPFVMYPILGFGGAEYTEPTKE